jgi:hypothetical protein
LDGKAALLQAIRRYKAARPPSDSDKRLWPLDGPLPFLDAETAPQVVTWMRELHDLAGSHTPPLFPV